MDLERVVERLRDYRLKYERFDRLVGTVLSNENAMGAARAAVAAARSVSHLSPKLHTRLHRLLGRGV